MYKSLIQKYILVTCKIPFFGRDNELARLCSKWFDICSGQPDFLMITGYRRTGKTFLILKFAINKRAIFHVGIGDKEEIELARYYEACLDTFGHDQMRPTGSPRTIK